MECSKTFWSVFVGLILMTAGFFLTMAGWFAPAINQSVDRVRLGGPIALLLGFGLLTASCLMCAVRQGKCCKSSSCLFSSLQTVDASPVAGIGLQEFDTTVFDSTTDRGARHSPLTEAQYVFNSNETQVLGNGYLRGQPYMEKADHVRGLDLVANSCVVKNKVARDDSLSAPRDYSAPSAFSKYGDSYGRCQSRQEPHQGHHRTYNELLTPELHRHPYAHRQSPQSPRVWSDVDDPLVPSDSSHPSTPPRDRSRRAATQTRTRRKPPPLPPSDMREGQVARSRSLSPTKTASVHEMRTSRAGHKLDTFIDDQTGLRHPRVIYTKPYPTSGMDSRVCISPNGSRVVTLDTRTSGERGHRGYSQGPASRSPAMYEVRVHSEV